MSRSPSRLDRAEHPPMSRAIRQLMIRRGMGGMDLLRALQERGVKASQSTVSRYYIEREPDYQMAGHVEDALGVPRGTLFSLAGYAPDSIVMVDSLAAVAGDDTLTDRQKSVLTARLLDSILTEPMPVHADALEAVLDDPRLLEEDRMTFAELIQSFRQTNELLAEKEANRPASHKRSKV